MMIACISSGVEAETRADATWPKQVLGQGGG